MSGVWSFDFDNEGDLDLLVSDKNGSRVLRNNGNGTFETLNPFENTGQIVDFKYADVDEDGDSDAVMLSGRDVVLYENERGGVFRRREKPLLTEAVAIAVGDTNGDGKLDINTLSANGEIFRVDENGAAKEGANRIAKTSNSECTGACFCMFQILTTMAPTI